MATLDEALAGQGTPLGADLQLGVEAISIEQTVTFTKYVRLVLPIDGFVFWVKADILSQSALLNAARFNTAAFNEPLSVGAAAFTLAVKGSLHRASRRNQDESETFTVNRMIFTAEQEVTELNQVGPATLFLATVAGVRFAFSERASFYRQAELWHYRGDAVYSDMDSQIVDSREGLSTRELVVSNSLPAWLALNGYNPIYPTFGNPALMLYPSFVVPANLPPPYAVIHIAPDGTRALQPIPYIGRDSSHWQLVSDRVRITTYGLRNYQVLDLVDCINQYSVDYDKIGVMNMPVVRDEKRTQSELMALSMKKTIDYEISYYQGAMRDIARQMILSAIPTYEVGDQVLA